MKLLCKAMIRDGECPYRELPCFHGQLHKQKTEEEKSKTYIDNGNWGCDDRGMYCACVPVGLEYYMKEAIKKHEENEE